MVVNIIVKNLLENNKDDIVYANEQQLNIGVVVGQESAVEEGAHLISISPYQKAISDISMGWWSQRMQLEWQPGIQKFSWK